MKYVFIVNPKSGKGKALEISKNIDEVCQKRNIDYVIHYTERPKDATMIAEQYKHEKNVIYSVGGDGTLNEIVAGMLDSKSMLGVIPGGTGNDFYKMLKNSSKLYQECDVGKVNNDYFINTLSLGIDADICDNLIVMRRKNIPPSQVYNASIIYTFTKFKPKQMTIELNDEILEEKITLLSVCNGTTYGNGIKIAPNANIDDGYFDVYIAIDVPKIKIPGLMIKLLKGTHEESSYVRHYRTNKLKITSKEVLTSALDGEIMVDKEFNVKLLPKKITIYHDEQFVNECLEKQKVYKKN